MKEKDWAGRFDRDYCTTEHRTLVTETTNDHVVLKVKHCDVKIIKKNVSKNPAIIKQFIHEEIKKTVLEYDKEVLEAMEVNYLAMTRREYEKVRKEALKKYTGEIK